MRYLIKFSYDGTKFHGFQRQKDVKNVQGLLEDTLSKYFDEKIEIKGSGRTDAGVHAYNQAAHFDVNRKIKKNDIIKLNELLNNEIIINSYRLVSNGFHARHSVFKKTYLYKINIGNIDKEKKGYYYQVKYDLNIKAMKKASKLFLGTHDFRNYVSGERIDYITTIFKIKFKKKENELFIYFIGIGFYRYMVRHLVGALMDVGRGKATLDDVNELLDNPMINKNLSVAPADGLYLVDVEY